MIWYEKKYNVEWIEASTPEIVFMETCFILLLTTTDTKR